MRKTYENAVKLLETRRRPARPKTTPDYHDAPPQTELRDLKQPPSFRGVPSVVGMKHWLNHLGHTDGDINSLNIIHVAGTKGKGSTCAFTRAFLQVHGARSGFPCKVGLYTSPDLRCIRERIQINNKPILEDLFAKYFFEIWEILFSRHPSESEHSQSGPRFLQLLALLAIHTFIREGADAAVVETHHGGEYDATNVIQQPIVTGITSIGLDHLAQLGPNIENIAWHKAGIFKPGVPAFSAPQDPAVAAVLQNRADQKGALLKFVVADYSESNNIEVLKPPVQRLNCSLALALVNTFLQRKSPIEPSSLSTDDYKGGLQSFKWPGRFETISDGPNRWFFDGAHNDLSIEVAAQWFSQAAVDIGEARHMRTRRGPLVLIFAHLSEDRDGLTLLKNLLRALREHRACPAYVIFTTYQERRDGVTRIDKTLKTPETPFPNLLATYEDFWRSEEPEANVAAENTIEGALDMARAVGTRHGGMETLITGSLHLVGGALNLLQPLK